MKILGISCYYHDSAAAILVDGQIIAAAEEERFSRIKHDSGFPTHAIDFCLQSASLSAKELDYVVFYEKPFKKFHRIFISTLSTYPKSYTSFREAMRIWLKQKLWIKQEIVTSLGVNENIILFSDHHLSHAAGCFFPSPFKSAAILTVDGVGEWTTASFGQGKDNKVHILKEMHFPQSVGLLYSAYTAFLGFEVNEGEWKVMGLAPYGKPKYKDKIAKTVSIHDDGSISLNFDYFSYHYSDKNSFSGKLCELLGIPIKPEKSYLVTEFGADIASSIQTVVEEIMLAMARYIKKQTGEKYLCLSGGVALNSVVNFKLLEKSGFENIYIQPSPGDSGAAIGSALYVYHHVLNHKKRNVLIDAYLGQQYDNQTIEQFLKQKNFKYKKLNKSQLLEYISEKITDGKVIGWMQDRFEWGPRALGNRSILADPRNPKMKEIINSKVKFREAFRPFAPSVLAEKANLIFNLPITDSRQLTTSYPLRFMLYVVPVKKNWQKKIPAINHVDNTARPQLVYKDSNPLYHALISSFYKKTGVPLILNTSFNLKGEPIVNSPIDAYSTFIRSGIDILVMGNYVIEK
jgi:carbamoyltransferase